MLVLTDAGTTRAFWTITTFLRRPGQLSATSEGAAAYSRIRVAVVVFNYMRLYIALYLRLGGSGVRKSCNIPPGTADVGRSERTRWVHVVRAIGHSDDNARSGTSRLSNPNAFLRLLVSYGSIAWWSLIGQSKGRG